MTHSTRPLIAMALLVILSGCASRDHRLAQDQGDAIRSEVVAEVQRFRSEDLIDPFSNSVVDDSEKPPVIVEPVTLESALRLGTRLNRGYLSQRESLFQSALSLGVTRRDFLRPVFPEAFLTMFPVRQLKTNFPRLPACLSMVSSTSLQVVVSACPQGVTASMTEPLPCEITRETSVRVLLNRC